MLRILILLLVGITAGRLLRKQRIAKKFQYGIKAAVCLLMLTFGISIGSDPEIINNIGNIGLKASVIACLGVAGSITAAYLFQRVIKRKGDGQ